MWQSAPLHNGPFRAGLANQVLCCGTSPQDQEGAAWCWVYFDTTHSLKTRVFLLLHAAGCSVLIMEQENLSVVLHSQGDLRLVKCTLVEFSLDYNLQSVWIDCSLLQSPQENRPVPEPGPNGMSLISLCVFRSTTTTTSWSCSIQFIDDLSKQFWTCKIC